MIEYEQQELCPLIDMYLEHFHTSLDAKVSEEYVLGCIQIYLIH